MERYEIKKYINQAVGSEGNLKIPAWWMNKILNEIVNLDEIAENNLKNLNQKVSNDYLGLTNPKTVKVYRTSFYEAKFALEDKSFNSWKNSGGLRIIYIEKMGIEPYDMLYGAKSRPISYQEFITSGAEVSVDNISKFDTPHTIKVLVTADSDGVVTFSDWRILGVTFNKSFSTKKLDYGITEVSLNPFAKIVDSLPTEGDNNTIYLIPENFSYKKWIYVDDRWESLDSPSITCVTHDELVILRDSGQLIPGQQYKITDYVATTNNDNVVSKNHPFDIIVTADSINTLNENARACKHDGDSYFANCNLSAWELKYSLDNNSDTFLWSPGNTERYLHTTDYSEIKYELTFSDDVLTHLRTNYWYWKELPKTVLLDKFKTYDNGYMFYNSNFKIGVVISVTGASKIYYVDSYNTYEKYNLYDCVLKPIYTNKIKENIIIKVKVTDEIQEWYYAKHSEYLPDELDFKIDNSREWYNSGLLDYYRSPLSEDNALSIGISPYGLPKSGIIETVSYRNCNNGFSEITFPITLSDKQYNLQTPIHATVINNGYKQIPINTSSNKGVVYYMKDEHGNECGYDFKNITSYISNFNNNDPCYTFGCSYDNTVDLQNKNYPKNNVIKNCIEITDNGLRYNIPRISLIGNCVNNTFVDTRDSVFGSDNENMCNNSLSNVNLLKVDKINNSVIKNTHNITLSGDVSNYTINLGDCGGTTYTITLNELDVEKKLGKNSKGIIKEYCEADLIA